MKTLKISIFLLTLWTQAYGQDGSDTRYFKTLRVDSSLIGQYVHFDFYNRSFATGKIDTVALTIDGRSLRFIEVRKDNGYNNWFSQQYLQALEKVNDQTLIISQFRLDSVTSTSFWVTMYVDFYDASNKLLRDKSRQIMYQFDKNDIVEILVKSKQHLEK